MKRKLKLDEKISVGKEWVGNKMTEQVGRREVEAGFHHVGQAGLKPLTSAGTTGACHYAWLIFAFLVETGFHHVGHVGLKLLTSIMYETSRQNSDKETGDLNTINQLDLTDILGDSWQRSHTGRQCDSFGQRGCFAGAPVRRFPVRSIRDGRARLVPSPQGKQRLETLRTESFTASTANPGRSGSVGNGHLPKEN
ncbi:hypothetical protein AAY473_025050 [Plecturocebus cupreus]